MSKEQILEELENKISDIEKRLEAGREILDKCRRQMRTLKAKMNETE